MERCLWRDNYIVMTVLLFVSLSLERCLLNAAECLCAFLGLAEPVQWKHDKFETLLEDEKPSSTTEK